MSGAVSLGAAPATDAKGVPNRGLITVSIMLATVMQALDTTIANVALPHMQGREGDIVTLASEAGRRGLPLEAVYCASKFGQVGFTRALDHELRDQGIRCANVCPGGVATDFALDDGRGRTHDVLPGMMTAMDVAEVVVFVLERPRHLRTLETALRPMKESSWG